MNKQISLSNLEDELSQVRTKKKEFLEQIDRIVPWNEWTAMIKPCYYKGERGNKPYDLGLMLRLYLIQNLYNLADEATVAEVTDSRAFSDFCIKVRIDPTFLKGIKPSVIIKVFAPCVKISAIFVNF